ncbi:MAG: hypothetical protein PHG35_03520 [Dehalococcoidales bacterium]|nr:hypothetical protein [Dehalococcoidales bacterium]
MTNYFEATIGGGTCGHHHRTYRAALKCALPVMRETYHSDNPTIVNDNGDEVGESWEHYKNRWINDESNSPVIERNE